MIMHKELAETLERSEIDYMVDRMNAIKEREGNPEGIEMVNFGPCTAFYSRTMPWGQFNNVKGPLSKEIINDIIQFYEERKRNFEIQVTPAHVNPEVMKLLAAKGYYQSGFHTTMYCEPRKMNIGPEDGLVIRELHEDEMDLYSEIHCLGTGLSLDGKPYVAANNQVLYSRQGWKFYLGLHNDVPAAVAVMYIKDQTASLTFAATLPAFRGQGFQSRLIQRRIHEAYDNDCKLVIGQCAYGSPSHRNMERAGMRMGYTRATWTKI